MSNQFEGQVALVTAAASGIGAATAKAFVEAGAQVMLCDFNEPALAAVVEELRQQGGDVDSHVADCTDDQQVKVLIDKTVESFGRLDVAVNAVGGALGDANGGEFHSQSTAGWDDTIGLSMNSCYLGMKHEITQMLKQGSGKIVNISSMAATTYVPDAGLAYAAAKAAVIQMTKFASATYAARGIRVNCITPGTTRTEAIETATSYDPKFLDRMLSSQTIKRMIEPSEQAAAILWLCSDAAQMITGHTLSVDGGWL